MLMPGAHVPQIGIKGWDKVVHFFSYAIFTFLLLKGLYKSYKIKNYFLLAAVISIGYGLVLELCQSFIPDRGVDVLDVIANTSGCLVALLIFPYIGR